MNQPLFQCLDIAGLAPATGAEPFIDIPPPAAGLASPGAAPAGPGEALLADLHAEFDRVVADPSRLAGRLPQARAASMPLSRNAAALVFGQAAPSGPDLLALVMRVERVDGFISRLAGEACAGDTPGLLDITQAEEVLRLFSPAAPGAVRPALPGTTLRDHHLLSPDSLVRLGGVETQAQEPPP